MLGGITPAYAGKRGSGSPPRSCRRDHPRVCGEKTTTHEKPSDSTGSPPRLRGKVDRTAGKARRAGITPAYAGKRGMRYKAMRSYRDHPRVCGEKYIQDPTENAILGSPPRMRGKECSWASMTAFVGITPACAGKRQADRSSLDIVRDHPRVCGEKSMCTRSPVSTSGSPPRMRGKVLKQLIVDSVDGITPTYAGKSFFGGARFRAGGDHPRVCGEKCSGDTRCIVDDGITPAYAGKSVMRPGFFHLHQDHPRVCGEKSVALVWTT